MKCFQVELLMKLLLAQQIRNDGNEARASKDPDDLQVHVGSLKDFRSAQDIAFASHFESHRVDSYQHGKNLKPLIV